MQRWWSVGNTVLDLTLRPTVRETNALPLDQLSHTFKCWGGLEDTRLEAKAKTKAKDTKTFEAKDQGHRRKCSQKKKVLKIFFRRSQRKRSSKIFFRRKRSSKNFFQTISTWGNQKKVFAGFPQGFWRFPTKFQRFKNSAVLEPRTGQFSRTWDFEAKDFKMCPRWLHLCLIDSP